MQKWNRSEVNVQKLKSIIEDMTNRITERLGNDEQILQIRRWRLSRNNKATRPIGIGVKW